MDSWECDVCHHLFLIADMRRVMELDTNGVQTGVEFCLCDNCSRTLEEAGSGVDIGRQV